MSPKTKAITRVAVISLAVYILAEFFFADTLRSYVDKIRGISAEDVV